MEYRNELKFLCSEQELQLLQARLSPVMRPDVHQNGENAYQIRSIYFDDYDNRCMNENEAGVDFRKKFRIRSYNHSDRLIRLEVKYKTHGKTKKESCPLTKQQFLSIMQADQDTVFRTPGPKPLNMLYLSMNMEYLRPKVIVAYDRTAFVCSAGNVRVTFDRNISSSDSLDDFFEEKLPAAPILESGQHLLEVKYDEFLPEYIAWALQMGNLRQTTFSKYYLCRKASKYNCI